MCSPSGSGKTTWANKFKKERESLNESVKIVSADHYFIQSDGSYVFGPTKLGAAHLECQQAFKQALGQYNWVIVDNTNLSLPEIRIYTKMAQEAGYDGIVVEIQGNFSVEDLEKRNIHGVPRATLEKQIERFNRLRADNFALLNQAITLDYNKLSLKRLLDTLPFKEAAKIVQDWLAEIKIKLNLN